MRTENIRDVNVELGNGCTYVPSTKLIADKTYLTKKEGEAFTESIKHNGFYDPLLIDRKFSLIDGKKRYFAAVRLGLDYIPCVFSDFDYIPSYTHHISDAVSDFTHFFTKAEAIHKLTDKHLFTQEAVAELIGRSQSYVANKLRLLRFTEEQRTLITEGGLSERHSRALLKIKDSVLLTVTVRHVVEAALNVAETEEYVELLCPAYREGAGRSNGISETMRTIDKLTDTAQSLGVLLKLNRTEDNSSVNYSIKIFK